MKSYKVGDLIQITGMVETYRVEKIWQVKHASYNWRWTEYLLVSPEGSQLFLETEFDDGEWLVSLYDQKVDLSLDGDPGRTIAWEGTTYSLDESGHAVATLTTAEGEGEPENMRYWDYEGPGDQVLSVEEWEGVPAEVWLGRSVSPDFVEHLPQ